MAGNKRKRTQSSKDLKGAGLGPVKLEDIPWAEVIIDPEPQLGTEGLPPARNFRRGREDELGASGTSDTTDQVPYDALSLFPLAPVVIIALAILCFLALGTGATPDF